MPDTSIYQHAAQPQLDIGRLIGIAGAARQLQSQSAISQALKGTVNPQTGQPDPTAALGALVKDPSVYLGPEDITQFTHAQQAQSQQSQFYNEQIGKGAGALYAKAISKAGASESDFNTFATIARKMNIPASTLMDARKDIVRPDGKLDPTKLANWYSIISGGQQLPQQEYMTGEGQRKTAPAATFMTGGPTDQGGGLALGTASLSLPTGAGGSKEAAAGESVRLLSLGPQLANNRSMLETLGDLSDQATTGPTSGAEQGINELAQRFGFKGITLTPGQLGATEEYGKIAATLQQQMATSGFGGLVGGHATDAFLQNSHSAMPNLDLSKLGRQGITHWLLGNNDAMQTMAGEWAKWIAQHPNMEGEFQHWMYNQLPSGMGQGFDINRFDPRVFQYERMTPEEKASFEGMIKGKGEMARFAKNVKAYEQKGWTGPGNTDIGAGTR